MKEFELKSSDDYLLHGNIFEPNKDFEYVIYIVHGMCEHKERYYSFMEYLQKEGYCSIICDLRGHGKNIPKEELGYFGRKEILIDDLVDIINYIKKIYKNKKIILFGHSMGSLIVRNYIQNNDDLIDKVILCGPPTENRLAFIGVSLCKILDLFRGDKYRSKLIFKLTLGRYNKGYKQENEWLTTNKEALDNYNNDEYCGFIFTINGFEALFYMLKYSYKKLYKVKNSNMPILLVAGSEDRVVGSSKKLQKLYNFLKNNGYNNISLDELKGMRHELINDIDKEKVYKKVINFIN